MKLFHQLVVGDAVRPKWLINASRTMLRAEIDGSYGTGHLKITLEEYVMNFVSVH